MGKPFSDELWAMPHTLAWTIAQPLAEITSLIANVGARPLITIGSGGSYASAALAARLHERLTGCVGKSMTPLEFLLSPPVKEAATLFFSASGRNKDILRACDCAIERNAAFAGAIIATHDSPLAMRLARYANSQALQFRLPTGKDGFLATNTLIATCAWLVRGYLDALRIPFAESELLATANQISGADDPSLLHLFSRSTLVLLTGGWGWPAGLDLESKLVEAALTHVQLADLRNFGHGRHHWLAKHGDSSALLFLEEPDTKELISRTVALIPPAIPHAVLTTSLTGPCASLALLLRSLQVVRCAGAVAGYDPGRPGVPDFGRKLYHLSIPRQRPRKPTFDAAVVLARKWPDLADLPEPAQHELSTHLAAFLARLQDARFCGVVLDYDGTLCSTNRRFEPPTPAIASGLCRLLARGLTLGIATGRGRSVYAALRAALPPAYWPHVLVGAYNGAEITCLSEEIADQQSNISPALQSVYNALAAAPGFAAYHRVQLRRSQVQIEPLRPAAMADLTSWVDEIIDRAQLADQVAVRQSGHTIDLVLPLVSKVAVVEALCVRSRAAAHEVLTIGDQGQFGGNDYELLSTPFSLSVDRVSRSPITCWNLAPRGLGGPAACVGYLKALRISDSGATVDLTALKSWWEQPYEYGIGEEALDLDDELGRNANSRRAVGPADTCQL